MSSAPSASPFVQLLVHPIPVVAASGHVRPSNRVLRRRPSMCQGQALEKLGRAIEFLYDSQVYQNSGELNPDDVEAVHTLMRLSREVFTECREVVPARSGLKLWLLSLFTEGKTA